MKIGIAQLNSTVGDFPGNAKRLLNAYREAMEQGAEIVVAPELALSGYTSRDLVFQSGYVESCLQALDYLAGEVGDVPFLLGYLDINRERVGKPFRNAAAFLHEGEVKQRVYKSLLPTYDVFDERRYFHPAEKCEPVEWNGRKLGVTICEDIWTEEFLERPLYLRDPVSELVEAGAEIILNLSASPYHQGKVPRRRQLVREVAREHRVPVVYCNAVGGNEHLVFDGHSLVVNRKGRPLAQLASFQEEIAVIDPSEREEVAIDDLPMEEELCKALVLGLRDYVEKCGFERLCLGLSGGIDSALTAVLAVEAVGADRVVGLTMPSEFSSAGSVADSQALAKNLGIACEEVSIQDSFESVKRAMAPLFVGESEDVTEENMQARLRGLFLMAYANKKGSLLISTGNKSELAVGYGTMYGDMCGGVGVLADVTKSTVYALARWINRGREIIPWNSIEKAPSAELRPDQKDQDSLPPYAELDEILDLYIEKQLSVEDILAQTEHGESLVRWVTRRVDLNEWKRYQAAPGIRVTAKSFGPGRRVPIVKKYLS
ncbi:MAG: NAD+ synthase [Verrucomicrobiales bacterium]